MKQELPINRVRRVIKQDSDIHAMQKQAVHAVSAATQLFISYFAEQAAQQAHGKRLQYKHFADVSQQLNELQFVRQIVPQQQTLASVLKRRQQAQIEGQGEIIEVGPEEDEPDHMDAGNEDVESSSDGLPEE